MSDMAMKYEDWLRGCVYHDGRKGNVYLPCDTVLEIADWIEAHRDVAPVVRCKDCKFSEVFQNDSSGVMARYCKAFTFERMVADNDFCSYGERKDNE